MSEQTEEITEALKRLEAERKQWLKVVEQAKEQLEQLEAAPKSIRAFVQQIADTAELKIQVDEVLETIRFYCYQAIQQFMIAKTLEDAINFWAFFLYLIRDLIPTDMFVKQSVELRRITDDEYGVIWKRPLKEGRGITVSRIVMPDVYNNFFEIMHYLLRLRFITAEQAEKSYVSWKDSIAAVQAEHGVKGNE